MQVIVTTRADHRGEEVPSGFELDGRNIEVAELMDEWRGEEDTYFKLKDGSGSLYILHFDEKRGDWDLTMFQTERGQAVAAELNLKPSRRPSQCGDGAM